jgi:8-oxo-dGTP pyrophosphatase MutT (NUDIX family)
VKKEIDKLAWLYIRDGKLLNARSKGKERFYIPGGKREEGESDVQALVREIKEEVSVNLDINTIKYAQTFKAKADGKSDDLIVKLTCYFADFEGELLPDEEIEEINFISYQDKHLCSLGSIKAMDWLKEKGLIY